ncbi:MAG TPA: M48 family metallopeptidase [Dongiaceae bacterium]|nr:M48 family metallopeptidase [Dongiaceae bacterium]
MNPEEYLKGECAFCGEHIEFPAAAAGSRVNCPHCQELTELYATENPAELSVTPPELISAAEVVNAFGLSIPRKRASFFYQIGLVLVAGMMVLLPVIYLGMIGLAGWGVYYYATHFTFLLHSFLGGIYIYLAKLVAYVTPVFAGSIVVLFMIKPLFASRPPRAQPLALNPAVDVKLFAFIARICDSVGAPMPQRIYLNCELNAGAGLRRGGWSLWSNDLMLIIGVPLVAGLNLQQFAGVIAHEFGHFTQGYGLRLGYVIDRVNGWFARVVYGRDAWDLWLDTWAEEEKNGWVLLVVTITCLAVGFSRLLLALLMYLGHGISCFLSRQMEYDADTCQIKVAGSAAFEETHRRLKVLGAALKKGYKEMRAMWNLSRKLPDNFPAYLVRQEASLPAGMRTHIEDTLGLARTGIFDTHPSDGDRIRQARRAEDPGIFHLQLPARDLFANFEVLAQQITLLHYNDDLGLECATENLRPTDQVAISANPV